MLNCITKNTNTKGIQAITINISTIILVVLAITIDVSTIILVVSAINKSILLNQTLYYIYIFYINILKINYLFNIFNIIKIKTLYFRKFYHFFFKF